MPKRATHTFESEKDGLENTDLVSLLCLCCGEQVLILGPGVTLSSLPRRRTDGAHVLERGETVFKLNSKPGMTKLLRREKGYERQWRSNCWNCDVPVAYRCEADPESRLTYLISDGVGTQSDLYLQLYQVPPCIQDAALRTVRVALEVSCEQPKMAITHVSDSEVGVAVCSQNREGLANAEVIELMMKVLCVTKQQLQLSRGWSQKSRFLLVSGMGAVQAFKALRAVVETELLPFTANNKRETVGAGDDIGPAATAGAASHVARRQWEDGEATEDLALPPSIKEQTFRN